MINIRASYLFIIVLQLTWLGLQAQSCDEEWLLHSKLKLDSLVISYSPVTALSFADSMSRFIRNKGLDHCEPSLWMEYNKGEALELNSRFKEALDIYYGLARTAQKNNQWALLVSTHISIARSMETIDRGTDCERHLKLAKGYLDTHQLWELYAFYCVRNSSYHRIFQSKDSALYYARLALHYGRQFHDSRQTKDACLLMGLLSSEIDSAIYFNQLAIQYFLEVRDFHGASAMAMNIYYTLKKNKAEAPFELWLDTVASFLPRIQEHNFTYHYLCAKYYSEKADQFHAERSYDSAYYYLKISENHLKQSQKTIEQAEISQAEIDYFTSIEKLKTESLRKTTVLQKIILIALMVGIGGLFWGLRAMYLKNKEIGRQKHLVQTKNDELAIANQKQKVLLSEIHHRVKNNLQLVISLLALHYNKVKDHKESYYLEEISNKIRSIALIHEHLYAKGEFEKIEFISYLRDLLEHYIALHIKENQFEYQIDSEAPVYLNLETVMPIGIICTELISNSLKYARRPDKRLLLVFKIQAMESKYLLKFSDNGLEAGAPSDQVVKPGMGTMLIESMVRQLQAQSSPINHGTAVFNLVFQERKISAI